MRYNQYREQVQNAMAKPTTKVDKAAGQTPEMLALTCADDSLALVMTQWLAHLRAERRLSPKTLEAYARDLRQCLQLSLIHI